MTRFKGFEKAAQLIRNDADNSLRTKIRPGTNDFYVLVRQKGDKTPWVNIKQTYTPIYMKAKFEIGNLTKEDKIKEDKFYSDWNIKLNNRFNRVERDNEDRQKSLSEQSLLDEGVLYFDNIKYILETFDYNEIMEEPSANSTILVYQAKRDGSDDENENKKMLK